MFKDDGPDPALLKAYGTDAIYLENLEKRANTEFLAPMLERSQGAWGRLVVDADRIHQERIDVQRAQAEILNQRFRHLEARRYADARENLGGPGTQRYMYQRQMMMHPYMIHPMYAESAMPMMMERTASVAKRVAKNMAKVAARTLIPLPENPHPYIDPGGLMSAEADLDAQALQAMGRGAMGVAQGPIDAIGDAASYVGDKAERVKELGKYLWRHTPAFLPLVVPQQLLGSLGRGVEQFMATDIQPTPRWGAGVQVPTNSNEYGISVGSVGLGH